MNKTETIGIMAILKEAYPMYYKNKTKEELNTAVNLWVEMFSDEDINLVKAAVKAYLANDIKGFPPVIGQIKNSVYNLTNPGQMTEQEAWGLVYKAVGNGYYNSVEEFKKLPLTIQNVLGSHTQLIQWSQMDSTTLQSVVASNFMRSYKARSQTEREYQKLPNDIKNLIDSTLLKIEG
ncbi:replicative helicase loader/inhibitor [Alkalibaculum sporogenes]|nr:replicative helicase loader/inhibitor [Alkalibaculum sporogenes]